MKTTTTLGATFMILLGASGCAFDAGSSADVTTEELGTTEEKLTASAPALPPEVNQLTRGLRIPAKILDRLFTLEHFVPVGVGRVIHVTETFSLRAFLRVPHRAILMLSGPLTQGSFMNIEVDGYRGRDRLAGRGFFSLSADFEGTGRSTFPADGRSPTQDVEIAALKKVIQYFRLIRLVPKLDVLGESWAGGVAAELCADQTRVRSCIMASMIYKTASDFANLTFRNPAFKALLDTLPDGYFPTSPDVYASIVGNSPPAVQAWTVATQPGRYTTVPLYDVFDLPFFDPGIARVPGRIIQGELDPNQPLSDTQELGQDYDTVGADVVVIPGGGHVPRVEPAPNNEIYWSSVEQFVDH